MQIALVFGLLVVALVLFSVGRLPIELISIGMLVVLLVSGILTPEEAFAGFSNGFVWTLASLFVISGALQQTGVLDLVGSRLLKQARLRPGWLITLIMSAVGFTSAFLNNTTVTAIYLAPVQSVARKMKISASKLLMPVAYASILGGTCTLIGTSTNIAVSGYLERSGYGGIGMFDMLPVGTVLFFVGLLYMLTIGKKLLPDHPNESFVEEFGLREYVSEIVVLPGSPLVGQRVGSSRLGAMGFRILNVIRGSDNFIPEPDSLLHARDILLVEGNVNTLMDVKETAGIEMRSDGFLGKDLQGDNIRLAEVLVTPQSGFVNSTLQQSRFRHEYGVVVIAINRRGQSIQEKIGRTPLRVGDVLLVQGPIDRISHYKRSRDLNILDDFKPLLFRRKKGNWTLLTFAAAIACSIAGWMPTSVAFLVAALAMVLLRCVTLDKAYESIDFRLLVLIAAMSAMGTAMTNTGAASWLSDRLLDITSAHGLQAVMASFIILTVFLTQPMSNAAAALVVLPVAIQAAQKLHVDPHPFAVAVMLSASVSLVTPFEPSCLMVYGPGRYRFFDYFKTGFLLTLLLMFIIVVMVPMFWHFQ
ncbi:MAG: SLC13 family permease [Bacteroidota bacterium]